MRIENDINVAPSESPTVAEAVEKLVLRITARDTGIDLSAVTRILITADLPDATQRFGGTPVTADQLTRIVREGQGYMLLFSGVRMMEMFKGGVAEVSRVIHHLHKDLWHLHDVARPRTPKPTTPLARALAPICAIMWQEYRVNRRTAWSVPRDSDLLMHHLAALLQALPGGMQEELTLYFADQDLDALFAKSLGRISHLMQAVAHVQGYLDGIGQPLQTISPDMHEVVNQSFLAPLWTTTARHLAAGYEHYPAEVADLPLRRDIQNAFATFGLTIRENDAGDDVWLQVEPPVPPEKMH